MSSASDDRMECVLSQLLSIDLIPPVLTLDIKSTQEDDLTLRRLAPFSAAGHHLLSMCPPGRMVSAVSKKGLSYAARRLQSEVRTFAINAASLEIMDSLDKNRVTVVCGDAGTGKTTQMPQLASDVCSDSFNSLQKWSGGIVLALPRRASTRMQFRRICQEIDADPNDPGLMAACRTRSFRVGSLKASVIVCTQGYLVQVVHGSILRQISVLILDDIQTRSEALSYLLAATRNELRRVGSKLKVILMGTEGDIPLLREYFGCSVGDVTLYGRRFDVERFELVAPPPGRDDDVDQKILKMVVCLLLREIDNSRDCILVFVKGRFEIEHIMRVICLKRSRWRALPFFRDVDDDIIDEIHALPVHAKCVVVVATDMGEQSITIRPVRTVISSCRVNRVHDEGDGIRRMLPTWASQQEVRSQGGRTGRNRVGKQVLVAQLNFLPLRHPPDIAVSEDLRWLVWVCARGSLDFKDLQWLGGQRPRKHVYDRAVEELLSLHLIDSGHDGALTSTARAEFASCISSYVSPNLAAFVLLCDDAGIGKQALRAAAFLRACADSEFPFLQTHVGFDEVKAHDDFRMWSSDLLLVSEVLSKYEKQCVSVRKEFCESLNLDPGMMAAASRLLDRLIFRMRSSSSPGGSCTAVAEVMEKCMLQAIPQMIAVRCRLHYKCHQAENGLLVQCCQVHHQNEEVVLPLDTRPSQGPPVLRACLAFKVESIEADRRCFVIGDSFLKVGIEGIVCRSAICRLLRRQGFCECYLRCQSRLRLEEAIAFLSDMQGFADAGVFIYNFSDTIESFGVREIDEEFLSGVDELLLACYEKCECLTFVVPSPELFPKFSAVQAYMDNALLLRSYLSGRGVHCVDAAELRGEISTYDDEHFCIGAEKIIAQSVLRWLLDARPMHGLKGVYVQEQTQEVARKVCKVHHSESSAASSRDFDCHS